MASTKAERAMVASWAITMHASGDNIGDLVEFASDGIADDVWDLPMTPQQFADKWAKTIESIVEHVHRAVLKEVPYNHI